jgi:hypothetical protein
MFAGNGFSCSPMMAWARTLTLSMDTATASLSVILSLTSGPPPRFAYSSK